MQLGQRCLTVNALGWLLPNLVGDSAISSARAGSLIGKLEGSVPLGGVYRISLEIAHWPGLSGLPESTRECNQGSYS